MKTLIATLALALMPAACETGKGAPVTDTLVVLTQNVYLGSKIENLMSARADSVPIQAAIEWGKLQRTNFAERASALARQIADRRPHLVGLQEVALYRLQDPSDLVGGGSVPATAVAIDFLQIVLDSLAVRGITYVAAAVDTLSDLEVPMVTGSSPGGPATFADVRWTDRDVVLVRADVRYTAPAAARFAAYLPLTVAGRPLAIYRGWSAVTASFEGRSVRFVSTHLEDFSPEIQEAQARELLAIVAGHAGPVVIVGDLNSDAERTTTATYAMARAAGYRDTWELLRPSEPGYTCCQAELLANATPSFDQRLDLVLVRGGLEPLRIERVGHDESFRTPSGLWPSDHAGVVATLRTAR